MTSTERNAISSIKARNDAVVALKTRQRKAAEYAPHLEDILEDANLNHTQKMAMRFAISQMERIAS